MAIAFDSIGTGGNNNFDGTVQWTHTISSNTNGILLAFFGAPSSSGVNSVINSAPKFAGNSLTFVIAGSNATGGFRTELWILKNPPTGLGTFQGTWSNSNFDKNNISLAYTGVDQTTPIAGSTNANGFAQTSGSVTRTLAANGWFVGADYIAGNPGTTTIGVERGTAKISNNELLGVDSTGGTLQWTDAGVSFAAAAAEITAAAVAAATNQTFLALTGVGNI